MAETVPIFLQESSKLNKVLKKNYTVDDECIFEYKKSDIIGDGGNNAVQEIKVENSSQLEIFKNKAFSKDGEIMKLIKFYEDSNYDKMKEELQILEHMAKYAFLLTFK